MNSNLAVAFPRAATMMLVFAAGQLSPFMTQDALAITGVRCTIGFAVQKTVYLGSMGWTVDYSGSAGWIDGTGVNPSCQSLLSEGLMAFNDDDAGHVLSGGFVAEPPVSTPRSLASCVFRGMQAPVAGDFHVVVTDANDGNVDPVVPLPVAVVSGIDCQPDTSLTTTTVTSTTSTTMTFGDCQDWNVVFRLDSASAAVGAVQFTVDYSAADGVFMGEGTAVSCQKLIPDSLFSKMDEDLTRDLSIGLISLSPFYAPTNLATCKFRASWTYLPVKEKFTISIDDAVDAEGAPIYTRISPSFVPIGDAVPCVSPCTDSLGATVPCGSRCGDGVRTDDEQCDDGNVSNTDGCLYNCMSARCGDGYTRASVEQCDDGNSVNTDACTSSCMTARCGDGFVRVGFEQCDDGNASSSDACLNTCVSAKCGDGFVRTGVEQCDDGNVSSSDACLNTCVSARCGDGFVRTGIEQCDDGNLTNTDACPGTCLPARCGDGYVRTGYEQCDDANPSNTDACLSTCVTATCGDGFLRNGVEQCDDGNRLTFDGCSYSCKISQACGDPTNDGRILVGDALRTLQRAVGLDVECPDWTCDINDDDSVSVSDSLTMLRASVGLPVARDCGEPAALVLRLATSSVLGGLQVDVSYAGVAMNLLGEGSAVECSGTVAGANYAFNDKPTELLSMSMLTLSGFTGQRTIARCKLVVSAQYDASKFVVRLIDVTSPAGDAVSGVQVHAIAY